jgi:DNA-binding NtrC family response regulator
MLKKISTYSDETSVRVVLRPMEQHGTGASAGVSSEIMKTIVMYSPDVDLCMSLTLYFQDKYVVVTTTDGNTLPTLVETYHPSLVIADALPTSWILRLFDTWKEGHPEMRVMLFRVWRYEDRQREAAIHKSIDFVLYKPIDIDFVAHIVNGLFEVPGTQASTS